MNATPSKKVKHNIEERLENFVENQGLLEQDEEMELEVELQKKIQTEFTAAQSVELEKDWIKKSK